MYLSFLFFVNICDRVLFLSTILSIMFMFFSCEQYIHHNIPSIVLFTYTQPPSLNSVLGRFPEEARVRVVLVRNNGLFFF